MLQIYNNYSDQNERKRIEKIDFLDELEEWELLMQHYFFLIAQKVPENQKINYF